MRVRVYICIYIYPRVCRGGCVVGPGDVGTGPSIATNLCTCTSRPWPDRYVWVCPGGCPHRPAPCPQAGGHWPVGANWPTGAAAQPRLPPRTVTCTPPARPGRVSVRARASLASSPACRLPSTRPSPRRPKATSPGPPTGEPLPSRAPARERLTARRSPPTARHPASRRRPPPAGGPAAWVPCRARLRRHHTLCGAPAAAASRSTPLSYTHRPHLVPHCACRRSRAPTRFRGRPTRPTALRAGGQRPTGQLTPTADSPQGPTGQRRQLANSSQRTSGRTAHSGRTPPSRPPALPGTMMGRFSNKSSQGRADAQRLVATRLLDRLHDPLGHFSRLQRIYPRAR